MAYGHSRICTWRFLHQQQGDGLADNLAPATHDDMLARWVVPGTQQHLLDARRSRRHESGPSLHQQANVGGVQAVDVLVRVEGRDYRVHVYVIGRRQLDQHPGHRLVIAK